MGGMAEEAAAECGRAGAAPESALGHRAEDSLRPEPMQRAAQPAAGNLWRLGRPMERQAAKRASWPKAVRRKPSIHLPLRPRRWLHPAGTLLSRYRKTRCTQRYPSATGLASAACRE